MTTANPSWPDALDRRDDRLWFRIAISIGLLSLFCYFFSAVFWVFPRAVSNILFFAFGPTLALSVLAFHRLLRRMCGRRPWFELGAVATLVAGVVVNLMAVIQVSNFKVMGQRILEAELDATKDDLRRVLWGVNNVQISLDIAFDIWISTGCVLFALGMALYLRHRLFGAAGVLIGAGALAVNFATLPTPPAEAGLFDPGPLVATWFGFMLALVAWRYRRECLR